MKNLFPMCVMIAILFSACEGGGDSTGTLGGGGASSGGASSGGGGSSVSAVSSSSAGGGSTAGNRALYIKMTTLLTSGDEDDAVETNLVDPTLCEITVDGADLPSPSNQITLGECTGVREELNMFYSKVNIEYGTDRTDLCPFMTFAPYYYRASNAKEFKSLWNDAEVDCSDPVDNDNADCYNGAAKEIVEGFPKHTSLRAPTVISDVVKKAVSSPFQKSNFLGSNRWILNPPYNLINYFSSSSFKSTSSGRDGYIPGYGQHYQVSCTDEFQEPLYAITVFLRDSDYLNGSIPEDSPDSLSLNDYGDWDSTLPQIDPQNCTDVNSPGPNCVSECTDVAVPYAGCPACEAPGDPYPHCE